MRADQPETSNSEVPDLSNLQNGLPDVAWAEGRAGYERLAASVARSSAVRDSMLLRKTVLASLTGAAVSASAA